MRLQGKTALITAAEIGENCVAVHMDVTDQASDEARYSVAQTGNVDGGQWTS